MQNLQYDASKFVSRQQQLAEIIKNTPGGGTSKDFQNKVPRSLAKNMSASLRAMYDKGILTRTKNHKGLWQYFYDHSADVKYCRGPDEETVEERVKTRLENLANRSVKPELVSLKGLMDTLVPYQPPLLPAPISTKQELEHRLNEHMLRTQEVLLEPSSAKLPRILPGEVKAERPIIPQEVQMVVGYKGGQEALYLSGREAKELYLTLHRLFG